jgi:hypothetical protein
MKILLKHVIRFGENGACREVEETACVWVRAPLCTGRRRAELCIDMDGSTSSGSDGSLAELAGPALSVPRDLSRGPRTEEIIAATTAVRPPG